MIDDGLAMVMDLLLPRWCPEVPSSCPDIDLVFGTPSVDPGVVPGKCPDIDLVFGTPLVDPGVVPGGSRRCPEVSGRCLAGARRRPEVTRGTQKWRCRSTRFMD